MGKKGEEEEKIIDVGGPMGLQEASRKSKIL